MALGMTSKTSEKMLTSQRRDRPQKLHNANRLDKQRREIDDILWKSKVGFDKNLVTQDESGFIKIAPDNSMGTDLD